MATIRDKNNFMLYFSATDGLWDFFKYNLLVFIQWGQKRKIFVFQVSWPLLYFLPKTLTLWWRKRIHTHTSFYENLVKFSNWLVVLNDLKSKQSNIYTILVHCRSIIGNMCMRHRNGGKGEALQSLFLRFAPNTHIYLYASTVHMYCIYPAILNRK